MQSDRVCKTRIQLIYPEDCWYLSWFSFTIKSYINLLSCNSRWHCIHSMESSTWYITVILTFLLYNNIFPRNWVFIYTFMWKQEIRNYTKVKIQFQLAFRLTHWPGSSNLPDSQYRRSVPPGSGCGSRWDSWWGRWRGRDTSFRLDTWYSSSLLPGCSNRSYTRWHCFLSIQNPLGKYCSLSPVSNHFTC